MKNPYYVIRFFRNGRSPTGYDCGPVNRFADRTMAEGTAARFALEVLPSCPSDLIVVGEGAIRNGLSVGKGKRIATYSIKDKNINGKIVRHEP